MSTWSSSMEERFKDQPTLLKASASNYSCCIFKAPLSLAEIDAKAYEPQIVSIGPYHHGKDRLKMVEQHKPRFFSALIERTKDRGVGLDDYFNAINLREKKIRGCYSEHLPCESSALVEMMVLDACFIVEVFRIFEGVIKPHPEDPFLGMPWIFIFLVRDLLGIENQIPFFVLKEIFDLSKGDAAEEADKGCLSELALRFFNRAAPRPEEQLKKFYGFCGAKHLLDLFRLSFIGHSEMEQPEDVDERYLELIPSATQLLRSGIEFKPSEDDNSSLIKLKFNNGVFQMPHLTLDDFISFFFLNSVAFEQCCLSCSGHITSYVTFIRCLVNEKMDAELLSENQILVNYLGSNAEVATFFNKLGKDCGIDLKTSYLAKIIEQVNKHHRDKWHVRWAGFKREYFGSPWTFISAVAAFVLLVLTVLQAFYAAFAYYRPPK